MGLNTAYLKSAPGILKLVEIVCVIIAFAISRGGGAAVSNNMDAVFFVNGVLVTGLIVTPLLLVCYIMGRTEIQKSILEVSLNALLFLFLAISGVVGCVFWADRVSIGNARSESLAMSSFCIIAGCAYLVDTLFSFRAFMRSD